MDSQGKRLKAARIAAGYATPMEAALALGVPPPTYYAHERDAGGKGLSKAGARYARFFGVALEWLLTGRGDMHGGPPRAPLMGVVGAGAGVVPVEDNAAAARDEIDLPYDEHLGALVVRGESQYPRFMSGEIILFDRRPETPGRLKDRYAVVDCVDGRRLIKKIVPGKGPGAWSLWSHNAPEEPNADILAAYRVIGVLTR